ncbi:hypothetical protein BJ165DRAFT_1534496 [Panaeolus papilionaceus]|nr:hypothetical protein BJ165DRAFT_1534496 [Panaeolus papilionaceus]
MNRVHRTLSQKAHALLGHLPQMTSLSEFKISCYPCDDGNTLLRSIAFIDAAWLGITNAHTNLSKLELTLPIEAFDGVVSGAPVLSQLETLILVIRENEPMDMASETQYRGRRIAEFVNTKCGSIRSLSLTLRILFDTVNSFLPSLQPLHNLLRLSLNIPIIYLVDFNVPLDTIALNPPTKVWRER